MRKLSEADTGSIGGFQPARREVVSKSASGTSCKLPPNLATVDLLRKKSETQKRIEFLEKKVQTKDEVLAELMAEHMALKKSLGEL